MNEDLCFQTITDLSKLLASKKNSPVELTRAYLDRSEDLNGKVAAVLTHTREHAMELAAAAEKDLKNGKPKSLLHVSYGVKDLLDTKGSRTTGGSSIVCARVQRSHGSEKAADRIGDAGSEPALPHHWPLRAGTVKTELAGVAPSTDSDA